MVPQLGVGVIKRLTFDREHTTGTRHRKSCDTITKFLRRTIHASNSNSTDALTFINLRRMK